MLYDRHRYAGSHAAQATSYAELARLQNQSWIIKASATYATCVNNFGDLSRRCQLFLASDNVFALADELAALNVELIEQPLPADSYDAMRSAQGKSPLPLMADESCQVESDVDPLRGLL